MKSSPAQLVSQAAYRASHKEEIHSYRASHREEMCAYGAAHKEEKRVYDAAYCGANRDAIRERKAAYYEAHKDERRAHDAVYRATHGDEKRAYKAAYHASVIKPRTDGRRVFLDLAKAGVGCADCGTTDMLDFHHRDKTTKKHRVANMLTKPWSEIMDEVFKCDVLCRSCHTKRHSQEDRLLVN